MRSDTRCIHGVSLLLQYQRSAIKPILRFPNLSFQVPPMPRLLQAGPIQVHQIQQPFLDLPNKLPFEFELSPAEYPPTQLLFQK